MESIIGGNTLFGWSPSATGILNTMVHPIVILLISWGISLILTIMLYLFDMEK